jgi:spore coat protein JB
MNRDALLRQITILDFMAVDLQLFLNNNPDNEEALTMYNDLIESGLTARRQYEQHFGPLTGFRSPGQEGWPWKNDPWPWEAEFNYEMGEC